MNLLEFLENLSKEVSIKVYCDDKEIMNDRVGQIDEDLAAQYWIIVESVTLSDGVFIIRVEDEKTVNKRIQAGNSASFSSILEKIMTLAEKDEKIKELFRSLVHRAQDYRNLRFQWEKMSDEEASRRNAERSMLHDLFIAKLNDLCEYMRVTNQDDNGLKNALGEERRKLGDFAMYLGGLVEKTKERINISEAIIWAIGCPKNVVEVLENKKNSSSVRECLVEKYEFNSLQAQAILDLRVKALCNEYKQKISSELVKLKKILCLLND